MLPILKCCLSYHAANPHLSPHGVASNGFLPWAERRNLDPGSFKLSSNSKLLSIRFGNARSPSWWGKGGRRDEREEGEIKGRKTERQKDRKKEIQKDRKKEIQEDKKYRKTEGQEERQEDKEKGQIEKANWEAISSWEIPKTGNVSHLTRLCFLKEVESISKWDGSSAARTGARARWLNMKGKPDNLAMTCYFRKQYLNEL